MTMSIPGLIVFICGRIIIRPYKHYVFYILSGTSIPNNPIPRRTTFATFSDKARRNTFTASFSSRRMLKYYSHDRTDCIPSQGHKYNWL